MNPVDAATTPAELLVSLFGLAGQTAIITGGGAGLGRDLALMFSAAGAQVVVADLNEANAKAVEQEIKGRGGKAVARPLDVTDEASVLALYAFVKGELG